MVYTLCLRALFRQVFGPSPEVPDAEATGLVLVADGVGGLELCVTSLQAMAARHAPGLRVEQIPWCHGLGRWYRDLTRTENQDRWAARTAERVRRFQAERPGCPVSLVGKSGGTGVVLRALEQLPMGSIASAVLLSPAASPQYDLTRALQTVRGQMTVFWSPCDVIILGVGTKLFGTVDRVHTRAAGLTGFRPPAEPGEPYGRLCQVRWQWAMARTGYLGGHVGTDSPFFLKEYVLPRLDPARDSQLPNVGRPGSRPVVGQPIR